MSQNTSTSPGNAGSRGSEGQRNDGAQPRADDGQRELPFAGETDLREGEARGGGGAGSGSSRSQDRDGTRGRSGGKDE
jgi:hypothetical protein